MPRCRGHAIPGRIDRREAALAMRTASGGQAEGDLPVRVVVGDELAEMALEPVVVPVSRCAEHDPGVGLVDDVARLDARIIIVAEAEDLGHAGDVALLGLVNRAVGLGDVEEPVEHVLQQFALAGKLPGDLAGIGFEAVGGLLGEVEQALNPLGLGIGTSHDLPERGCLVLVTTPSALAILADRAMRPVVNTISGSSARSPAVAVHDVMTGEGADERAQGTAQREAQARAADASPRG